MLIVAGVLVLAALMVQRLIFEAAAIEGYALWPLLVAFVALVIVLAPGLDGPDREGAGRRNIPADRDPPTDPDNGQGSGRQR